VASASVPYDTAAAQTTTQIEVSGPTRGTTRLLSTM
jgi:hypothetical protein